jgi:hypothetical protein
MSPSDLKIFRRVCKEEQTHIATHYWTSAEAISKAKGRGLPMMLRRQLDLQCASQGSWEQYQFAVCDTDAGLTCSLATDGPYELREALAQLRIFDVWWEAFVVGDLSKLWSTRRNYTNQGTLSS